MWVSFAAVVCQVNVSLLLDHLVVGGGWLSAGEEDFVFW
jgi:hypothetical protein